MARPRPHLAGHRDTMKICLVSPYDFMHPGGVTEHVRHLSAKLRARGHDVTVLAPSSRVGDDHGIPGYVRIGRSVPVRTNGSVARIALSFHLVRRVRALLDENHFDVVHYHEPLVPS
ncbi:MAG TPA: glycosyltransferase, partial [Candidatus Dormibacteraeota bacterium]